MKKLRKLFKPLYDALPFKIFVFNIIRGFGYKGPLTKFLYFKGNFTFQLNGEKIRMYNPGYQSHIENMIFWNGVENGWEKNSVKNWIALCKRSKVIVDVGANTGIFSLLALKSNPAARVLSFEPVNFIADIFKKNMALNSLKYELYTYALSDSQSSTEVFSESTTNSYTISIDQQNVKPGDDSFYKLKIDTKRFDKVIEDLNLPCVDLMKIDVERHEPMVLEGMGIYLEKFKPDILVEVQSPEIADKIQQLVRNINYLFFNIDDLGGIRQTPKLEKSDYLNYLLCSEVSAKAIGLI